MKSLSELAIGQTAKVVGYSAENGHAKRLKSLGLVPGTEVTVKRFAPLGDPLQIFLRGYSLGLRKSEVDCVRIEINADT